MPNLNKLTLLVIAASLFAGCSSMESRDIVSNHETKDQLYGMKYAQNVVKNIQITQEKRFEDAWAAGPSYAEIISAKVAGVDPHVGWSPKVSNAPLEIFTEAKYKDVIELAMLFHAEPVDVKANDKITIVTMPQDWVWTYSSTDLNTNAKQFLGKMFKLLNAGDYRYSVYVNEGYNQSEFGRGWRAEKKAAFLKAYLVNDIGLPVKEVYGFGMGNKLSSQVILQGEDYVQLVIYSKKNVDSSEFAEYE